MINSAALKDARKAQHSAEVHNIDQDAMTAPPFSSAVSKKVVAEFDRELAQRLELDFYTGNYSHWTHLS